MVVDRDFRYLAVNRAYAEALNVSLEGLVGRRVFEAFPGDVAAAETDPVRDSIERVFRSGREDVLALVPFSVEVEGTNGRVVEERYWSATHTPLFNEAGETYAVLQHTTDVTDVRSMREEVQAFRTGSNPQQIEGGLLSRARAVQHANQDLHDERRHLMSLFAQAPGFIAVLRGADDTFEIVNSAYKELVGKEDIVGHTVRELLPELAEQGYLELLGQVRQTGQPFVGWGMPVTINAGDSSVRQRVVDFVFQPIIDSDQRVSGIFVQGTDVTERESALSALRESESRFRTMADMIPQMVWSTLPDGLHDYYNRQWYAFTGVEDGSTDGEGWAGMFHSDDQDRARARWRTSLQTGQPYEIEYRLRHKSGEYRWVLGRALPIRDANGNIVRWMGTCTEIEEQKAVQAALESSEQALQEANRRKDQFLAMLAHELRNPLAPIATAAKLLQMGAHDATRAKMASEIIDRQVGHMTHLVNDLLDVSRVTRGQAQLVLGTVDVASIVRHAIEQVTPLVERKDHQLVVTMPDAGPMLEGDGARLIQVVANLLNNAAKYTPPGGRIEVEVLSSEGLATVVVADNGMGIDAALLPHVFDLFTQAELTPERSEGGLGIGLTLAQSLVALHGGSIEAHSDGLGQGSRFLLRLPTNRRAPGQAMDASSRSQGHPLLNAD